MRQPKHFPNYTLQDYELWEGDWELIEGIPYSMSPSANSQHQELSGILIWQIRDWFRKHPNCNCKQRHDLDWRIDLNTVVRPDIAITCKEESGNYITFPPVLIIEILSKATAYNDRVVKLDLYQSKGVKYYIIADIQTKTYTVYQLSNGHYLEQQNGTTFQLTTECSLHLDMDQAFQELEA
ncbi:MAG: Uma2 family endonuclease [Chitinophagales bacterium]|nr:Uma2 family endonuclease [Chitinophagales bacterium]